MATPRFAWGIDVGNRALKAVKLVSTAEGLVIDDFDVIEHENILSRSGRQPRLNHSNRAGEFCSAASRHRKRTDRCGCNRATELCALHQITAGGAEEDSRDRPLRSDSADSISVG